MKPERKTTWMDLKLARIEENHQGEHDASWREARAALLDDLAPLEALRYSLPDDMIDRPLEKLQALLERIEAIEAALNARVI